MEERTPNSVAEFLSRSAQSCRGALKQGGAERLIGEKLLNYVGMLLIVLGGAFFLKYTAGLAGPWGKLAIGLLSGLGLLGLGEVLNRDSRYEPFSLPVIGGGWILVYYTVFAAHYLPASKVIGSVSLELLLLCVTAACMIGHSLKTRSRLLTVFAFGAAYFAFAITHLGVQTLTVCTVLALAGACLVRPLESPEVAAVNLAGYYLNYLPVFTGMLGAGSVPPVDFWYSLGTAAAVHVAYAVLTPRRQYREATPWLDAALSFSAVLFAASFYGQVRSIGPAHATAALLALSAVLTGLSAAHGKGEDGSALSQVQALLGAAVLALAVLGMGDAAQRSWGLALSASALGTLGLWLDRRSLERYGLGLMGLALLCGAGAALSPAEPASALSLCYAGASGYALGLLRGSSEVERTRLTSLWLHGGLLCAVLGFCAGLQAPAAVIAALSLALLLEWAAAEFDLPPLLHQALLLELGAGLAVFLIGGAEPRLWTTGAAVAAFGTVLFGRVMPDSAFMGLRYTDWRRAECWLMAAVAAYGFHQGLDPLLRLPLWALCSLLLLALGRSRTEPGRAVAADLRCQAYLLALAVAADGILAFVLYPHASLVPLGPARTVAYWASSLMLLLPLAWRGWAGSSAEEVEALVGEHLFACLSLVMLAVFIGKEWGGTTLTIGWTLLGVSYLLAGLALGRRSLRLPGLALSGLCVLKALFLDMSGLELPYRVLSYTLLGGLLLLSSYLYVHANLAGKEDCDEA